MSTREDDADVVELAAEFAGLLVAVHGRPEQAAAFVAQVAHAQDSQAGECSEPGGYPTGSALVASPAETVLESFPPCPCRWVVSASSILRSQTSRLSASLCR